MQKPLIINAPTQGIASSPHLGYGDCRCLDIYSVPGVAKINNALVVKTVAPVALPHWLVRNPNVSGGAFALDSSGVLYTVANNGTIAKVVGNAVTANIDNTLTSTAHGLLDTDTVKFSNSGGALPAPLSAATTYYVINSAANTFKVSLTSGGAEIDITDTGTGTHTVLITTSTHGNGLVVLNDHVLIARDTAIDTYKISTGVWAFNWQADMTLIDSDVLWHPMIVSKNDGKIYGGAGRYVFSIEEIGTFDPANSATYSFTAQALDLPLNYRIKCLAEQGNNLMIGTWIGASAADFVRVADIFPWDRSSPSFGQPISLEENGIHAMITKNSILYILAGIEGRIYSSNGVQTSQIAQIPDYVRSQTSGGAIRFYPGAIAIWKEKIIFGVSDASGGSGGNGVWSLQQTSKGNVLTLDYLVHTGNAGETNALIIGAILPSGYTHLRVGFQDNTTYGINDFSNYYSSYTAFFDSPVYSIGTPSDKNQFCQLELIMAKEFASDEGVKIQYRLNLTDSFTDLITIDYATYGAIHSYNTKVDGKIKIAEADTIQFRVLLTGSSTTPHFKTLIMR